MNSIKFLTVNDVLLLYKKIYSSFGGRYGIRDRNLLESAIAQPQLAIKYSNRDIFEIAADYLFHIIKNHPFIDGNKRTGLTAALTFLEMNGYKSNYDLDDLYELTIAVAISAVNKEEIAQFFRVAANKN